MGSLVINASTLFVMVSLLLTLPMCVVERVTVFHQMYVIASRGMYLNRVLLVVYHCVTVRMHQILSFVLIVTVLVLCTINALVIVDSMVVSAKHGTAMEQSITVQACVVRMERVTHQILVFVKLGSMDRGVKHISVTELYLTLRLYVVVMERVVILIHVSVIQVTTDKDAKPITATVQCSMQRACAHATAHAQHLINVHARADTMVLNAKLIIAMVLSTTQHQSVERTERV